MGTFFMSTATGIENQSVKYQLVRGIPWALFATACAIAWNAEGAKAISRYATPEVRKYESGSVRQTAATPALASWIRELEENLGLTRAGLAAFLGVSRPTLYSWTRGSQIRKNNAAKLRSLVVASQMLKAQSTENALSPLWQHQKLPALGMSFAEGMGANCDPEMMAHQLIAMWQSDALESQAIGKLFFRKA
jgi:DNA-binding transcriptional regulator YiaG